MLRDVIAVEPLANYELRVTFDDGVEGVVDVAKMIEFTGIFEPMRDLATFAQVQIHPELGTLCWVNGADLDSDVLYAKVTGKPIPECVPAKR